MLTMSTTRHEAHEAILKSEIFDMCELECGLCEWLQNSARHPHHRHLVSDLGVVVERRKQDIKEIATGGSAAISRLVFEEFMAADRTGTHFSQLNTVPDR